MRIRDWRSDVCSSDLAIESGAGEPVHRAWDIGVRDDTSIWWFQVVGSQLFILDCYSENGVGVDHYAEVIAQRREKHGWDDGRDYVPHDARVKEWGTGRTRVETMQRPAEPTSELQSLMRISSAVFCLNKITTPTSILT